MAEHYASAIVNAPVHQVYMLFTHFNDFPKFMRFVKEVTYYDDLRSHWVVQILGRNFAWDAVNEDWIPDKQVGWRSTRGLRNTGRVKFLELGPNRTTVDVYISYSPPSGPLGVLGENLGVNTYFESLLREELQNFARMVEEAPPGVLDPMSSHYLFHRHSAATTGTITSRQQESMKNDPMMTPQALAEREARMKQEEEMRRQVLEEAEVERKRKLDRERQAQEKLQTQLANVEERRLQESLAAREQLLAVSQERRVPDPVYDTIGGRNASMDRTSLGERDALRPRHPTYHQDPMTSRLPDKAKKTIPLSLDEKYESPWFLSIRGGQGPSEPPANPQTSAE
jgi:hypothetical protein